MFRRLYMELDFPNSVSLLENASAKKLYQQLVIQLNKDFLLANIPLEIPLGISPEDLIALLREKIYQLIMEQFPVYLNLLYIVDVKEEDFAQLSGTDAVEMADQVSFLLLRRIWKKVWFRQKFS